MGIPYCPYCNSAQSLLMGNIYCSHQSDSVKDLDNGVMVINSRKLEETDVHLSRLSIRCITGGEQYYKVGSHEHRVTPENYLVINQGQQYKTSYEADGNKEMMLIAFSPGFAEEILYSVMTKEDKLLDDPFQTVDHPIHFFEKTYESDAYISNTFTWFRQLMNEDMSWKKIVDLDAVYSGVLIRLLQIQRGVYSEINKINSVKFSTRKELYRRLTIGKEFLDNNLHRKISVEEVARIASLSPHHFKRTFKNLFGDSPHTYHVKKRLEYSRQLIEVGGKSVSEICQQVGFEDASSFIRLFKNYYECTPGGMKSGK
ncbi:MAG: helix-turn-helix transcriptional regulator [Saprospiraceae bacterium]|nr:helix-turn-helix transcriptional regulator [Saprospiraceae bacterium]